MATRSWRTSRIDEVQAVSSRRSSTGEYYFAKVATVEDAGVQPVYSIRVDTDDHAFITNGFVSHNTECAFVEAVDGAVARHR